MCTTVECTPGRKLCFSAQVPRFTPLAAESRLSFFAQLPLPLPSVSPHLNSKKGKKRPEAVRCCCIIPSG